MPIDQPTRRLARRQARAFAESLMAVFGPHMLQHARAHAERRARFLSTVVAGLSARSIARERAIAAAAADSRSPVQAGLFDGRSLKEKWDRDQRRECAGGDGDARAHLLESDASVRLAGEPEVAMLLISCCQG
jgi:hypothetical protein